MSDTFVKVPECYPQLLELRKSKTVEFKSNKFLKETTKLRYYQVIGALHMMLLNRMVLGDAAGLGKTIETIAAYTFLLERDPTLKLLVVTTKSALYQWAEEFTKFTQGVTVRVVTTDWFGTSGFAARKAQYDRFTENVMIIGYNPILDEYEHLKDAMGSNYMAVFDECFEYHTPILLEDGSTELIGKIVTEKKPVKVLSYNSETGEISAKKVVNFFRSPATTWWKIEGKEKPSFVCSPNHSIPTLSGKKMASELKIGDTIYSVDRGLTNTQKQIILGSVLGDGGIESCKRFEQGLPTAVKFMQSSKRSKYFFFKTFVLAEHIRLVRPQTGGWSKAPVWHATTHSNPIIRQFIKKIGLVKNGKKVITKEIFDFLDPIGLAIWFCDDGSRGTKMGKIDPQKYSGFITFSTHGFTKKDNQVIIDCIKKKWDISFQLKEDKRGKGFYLYSSGDEIKKFFDLIRPYIPFCMAYKLPESLRDGCGSYWQTYKEVPFWDLYEDTVIKSESKEFAKSTEAYCKFNIEVEDNHTYFANGILVHNCQAFKGRKTKTHFGCSQVAAGAKRAYGLSATVIKNSLEEVWAIYAVLVPGVFGNITNFNKTYTYTKLLKLKIKGKDRVIPQIDITKGQSGYRNLQQFKQTLDPYILVRKKEEVAAELPKLISRQAVVEMLPDQKLLYKNALNGIIYEEKVKREYFEVSDRVRGGFNDEKTLKRYAELKEKYEAFLTEEGKKRGKLAALTYCQMISNGPALIGEPGESSKEIEFERLISDELTQEKIIVFTRFKRGITNLEIICDHKNIGHTKITGDITSSWDRDQAKKKFMEDTNCRIIFITTAGSASLNLQAASVIIFYDTPWSYGDLVQTIGRAQRIGSIQEHVLLLHIVNKASIDMRVMQRVASKKELSDEVLGDTSKGALDFTGNEESVVDGLFEDLLEDVELLKDE